MLFSMKISLMHLQFMYLLIPGNCVQFTWLELNNLMHLFSEYEFTRTWDECTRTDDECTCTDDDPKHAYRALGTLFVYLCVRINSSLCLIVIAEFIIAEHIKG